MYWIAQYIRLVKNIETFFSMYRKQITSFKQSVINWRYFNMDLNFGC